MAFVVFSRKRNFFPLRTNPFKVKWTVSKVYRRIDHTKHWKKQKGFFSGEQTELMELKPHKKNFNQNIDRKF
jgi:hypothetical protein